MRKAHRSAMSDRIRDYATFRLTVSAQIRGHRRVSPGVNLALRFADVAEVPIRDDEGDGRRRGRGVRRGSFKSSRTSP